MPDKFFKLIAARFPTHRIGENKVLQALWRVLFYILRPREPFILRIRDYRLYADPRKGTMTRTLIRRGYWEPTATQKFLDSLRPGGLVIDAGANFGHYSLCAASFVGPDGVVVAFEPHPASYALLDANRKLLPYDNLYSEQAGLGEFDGTMNIYTDAANPGGHSFFVWNLRQFDGSSSPVAVHSLDSFLSSRGFGQPVSAIKIDVQGYEMQVLLGAQQTIERDRPGVLCEVTPKALSRAGYSTQEVLNFFDSRGYTVEILLSSDGLFQTMSLPEAVALFDRSEAEYHDVFFRPVD